MAVTPGTTALAGIGNMLGGSGTGESSSFSLNSGQSWGSSVSDSWNEGNSVADSWSKSEGSGSNNGYSINTASSAIYGSEATAKEIELARTANAAEEYFMNKQMEYNAYQAEKAREWQALMDNTKYQRQVQDLLKAGLNPILAVQNLGGSVPSGVYATSGLGQAYKANATADQRSYSYGQSESKGGWSTSSESGSHSESHSSGRSHGTSSEGSKSGGMSTSKSKNTSGLADVIGQVGKFFSGLSSSAKNWDGYDGPTVQN